MGSTINTNIPSLNAQRNLTTSQSALATSLQRLSSGLRINSAKDDAAGLAISERFSTQIRGLNQAARNANDGISLAQTAEGAMGEVSANLQRIRELAVQSANATNSASDRAALDSEVQMRVAELNRVASQTEFNGTALLNGTFSAQSFQVGANQGQTITVSSIASATAAALGLNGGNLTRFNSTGIAVTGALSAGDLTLNGADIGMVAGDAKAMAAAINNTDSRFGATATNAQTAVAFTNVQGAGATPSTFASSLGTYTTARANGVAASVTPAVASTVTPGLFTQAVANGSAAVARDVTYGAFTTAVSGANNATTASTASSGAFTGVTLGAGQTYSISLTTNGNTVNLFTQTNGVVATADITQAITANAAALTAAGITVVGTAAGGDLQFTNTTGAQVTTNVLNQSGAGGFANVPLGTGANTTLQTAATANGVLANAGTAFSISIGGNLLYSEAGATGGTVTGAELDTAMTTFLAAHTNYSVVSGSFNGGNLKLRDANGVATSTDITMTDYTGGTNAITTAKWAGVAGNTSGVVNAAGSPAVAPTAGDFTLKLDGATIYNEAPTVGGIVTKAELDTGLNTYLAGAGSGLYTKTGSFFGNDLVISKLNGTTATLAITSNFGGAGSTLGAFAGTLVSSNGSAAVVNPGSDTTDTAFTMTVDGIQLYTEAAAIGATVTASELDSALTTFLTLNSGYSKVSGDFANNNLVLRRADGNASTIAITSNFSGTAGAFTGMPGGTITATGTPATVASSNYALTLDGSAVTLTTAATDGTISGAEVATAISGISGFSASFSGGNLTVTKADGSNFTLAESGTLAATQGLSAASTLYRGSVSLNSSIATTVGGASPSKAGLTAGAATSSVVAYTATNVLTATAANTLLEVVDNALTTVNNSRASLGSIQNRFESVINSLTTTTENLTAARSRILDTDFAAETASLTRNQILQQAGVAMLAQANALPQSVLSLLK